MQIYHHGDMLNDHVRLKAFRDAIKNSVSQGDNVVDIGSGIGPLGCSAVDAGAGTVTCVEYLPELAEISRQIFKRSGVKVITGRSYDVEFDQKPDIVVTETIGPVCPEENIVELTYDLKRRYPNIRKFIPEKINLRAQAAFSGRALLERDIFLKKILNSSSGAFDTSSALNSIENLYCKCIYQDDISDAIERSEQYDIVGYVMGEASCSDFVFSLDLSNVSCWNIVSISFDAQLTSNISLTNHFLYPLTHWLNSYVYRYLDRTKITLRYDSRVGAFSIDWDE